MKREDLLLITPEQFKKFGPCWLKTREGRARFNYIAKMKDEWNALDVLDLEDVRAHEKLWSVSREEFLPPMLLHEFACRCAEWALSLAYIPDPRSIEVIRTKRRWMEGNATDIELDVARGAASCAKFDARPGTELRAARPAELAAESSAPGDAGFVAGDAAEAAVDAVAFSEPDVVARKRLVKMLRDLIDEWEI